MSWRLSRKCAKSPCPDRRADTAELLRVWGTRGATLVLLDVGACVRRGCAPLGLLVRSPLTPQGLHRRCCGADPDTAKLGTVASTVDAFKLSTDPVPGSPRTLCLPCFIGFTCKLGLEGRCAGWEDCQKRLGACLGLELAALQIGLARCMLAKCWLLLSLLVPPPTLAIAAFAVKPRRLRASSTPALINFELHLSSAPSSVPSSCRAGQHSYYEVEQQLPFGRSWMGKQL